MNSTGFFKALVTDWVSLMGGIASVALTIIGFARKWEQVPRWAFSAAGLVCFFLASARIWTTENRKVRAYASNSDAPYVYLQYSPTANGPSGFSLTNAGQENAIRVRINEIRVGERSAKFGELPAIRNDGQSRTTYSTDTELAALLADLPAGSDGRASLTVSVDYWAIDNLRKFRTTCDLDFQLGYVAVVLQNPCRRELLSF